MNVDVDVEKVENASNGVGARIDPFSFQIRAVRVP